MRLWCEREPRISNALLNFIGCLSSENLPILGTRIESPLAEDIPSLVGAFFSAFKPNISGVKTAVA